MSSIAATLDLCADEHLTFQQKVDVFCTDHPLLRPTTKSLNTRV